MIGLLTSSLRARMLSTPEFGAYSLVLSVISLAVGRLFETA